MEAIDLFWEGIDVCKPLSEVEIHEHKVKFLVEVMLLCIRQKTCES